MTEKLRDGISRELRYMEYKFRKRQSDRDKKKKKKEQYPTMYDPNANLPSEMREVAPSNRGEEDLQLQVALAMSREDAMEKEKGELSDKVRLEMALKESAEVAAKVVAQNPPTHAPVAVNGQASDPWGVPVAESKPDLFGSFDAPPAQKAPATNGFGGDPWGASSSQMSNPPATSNSWKQGAPAASGLLPPPVQSPTRKVDPWGSTPQPVPQTSDPFNALSSPPSAPSADPWGGLALSTSNGHTGSFDPFVSQSAAPVPVPTFSPQSQNFDPLNDFDQLSIKPSQPAQTLTPYAGSDFLAGDLLVPQPAVASTLDMNENKVTAEPGNKTDSFLGANASLVNIDSLVTKPPSNHPYITINTTTTGGIGASRNPFNQKGPSLSLNQLKGDNPTAFGGQVSPNPAMYPAAMPPMPGMGLTMAPMQPGYNMAPMMSSNPFASPQPIQANAFAPQQNQSLF